MLRHNYLIKDLTEGKIKEKKSGRQKTRIIYHIKKGNLYEGMKECGIEWSGHADHKSCVAR